jgi:O-antigen/teichoic acid export membrane protein
MSGQAVFERFRRGAATALALQVASVGLLFAMHVALGRVLEPTGYGQVAYALSVAGLVALVISVGMPNATMRFVAEYCDTGSWARLKGLLIRSAEIMGVGVLVGSAGLLVVRLLIGERQPELSTALLYSAWLMPVIALGQWRARAARGFANVPAALIPEEVSVPLLVIIGLAVLGVQSPHQAVVLYLAVGIVALAAGMAWLWRLVPESARRTTPEYHTRYWLTVALPMTFAWALQLSLNRTDVILLGVLSEFTETGVYVAAARVSLLCTFVLRSVDIIIAPLISAAYHGGRIGEVKGLFYRSVVMSAVGAFPLVVVAWVFAGQLLSLFGEGFGVGASLLRILAAGQFVNAMTGSVAITLLMTGHERTYARTLLVASVVGLAVNYFAIARYGAIGAAWTTAVVTGGMNLVLFYMVTTRVLRRSGGADGRPGEPGVTA